MRWSLKKIVTVLLSITLGLFVMWYMYDPRPETITYGMSFNTPYAEELGLDWRQVYDSILGELKVRHLRLAAHWPMVEPERDVYNFTELDYQLDAAAAVGADVILAVGRRLPRWPECHIPDWAASDDWDTQQQEILEYLTKVVERYKDHPAITYWQLENEPYLNMFANEHCGDLDKKFLKEELQLLKSLDDTRPVLITDSGNLGMWFGPYFNGDAFGTSVYVYFWNPDLGQFKTILPPWFYWVKEGVMEVLFGKKESMLIELSAEPWLIDPVIDVDLPTQFSRMDTVKFAEIIDYARDTRFEKQYLWGAEWWYWLRLRGYPEMWDAGKKLFGSDVE